MAFSISISAEWFIRTDRAPLTTVDSTENPNFTISLFPDWYKQISLEWSVPPEFGTCIFNVYFSQTEDGPFEKITSTPLTGTFLSDTSTQEYSKFHNGWYIVEAILLDKGNVKLRSTPTTWDTTQTHWVGIRAAEIQRREYLLLNKFVGVKSYLFRKKNYGRRCPACWDSRTEQILDDHCPVCIGTSFEGGFFEPAPLFLQYETTPSDRQKVYYGAMETNQIGAWTISVPEITPHDIIVRTGDWGAYRVDRIMRTELQANTVRQIMTLTQLSKGDVEYQLIKKNLPEAPKSPDYHV